jgi:peptidoglycan/LPS O-acetylase OafA/YrhL
MPERRHIPPLTSVRFLFALLVVLYHLQRPFERAGYRGWGTLIPNLIDNGNIGVTYFFVLSGFILTYTYADQFGTDFKRQFWAARLARIYPVYLLGIVLVLPSVLGEIFSSEMPVFLGIEAGLTGTLQLTLLQAWVPSVALSWNAVGWSLSVEAFFYLLFPALAIPLWRWPTRVLLALALGVYAISVVTVFLAVSISLDELVVRFNPILRLPPFILGSIAGVVFLRHGAALRAWGSGIVLLGFLGSIFVVGLFGREIPSLYLHDDLLAPFAVMLLLGLALSEGLTAKILSHPFLVRLGAASYALYIIHTPLTGYLYRLDFVRHLVLGHPMTFLCAYLFMAVSLSFLALKLIEEPCRRAILRRLASSHPRPVVLAR